MLAPLEPAELLYERLQEPSDESPVLYRERAYLVDALNTDDDLEEHLEAELSRIRRDWRSRDASQFVHLSLFDQRFRGEPSSPPIATLSWKDWQGRTEIWVRGVRRSTLPPGVALESLPPVFPRGRGLPKFSRPPAPGPIPAEAIDGLEELEAIEELEEVGSVEPSARTELYRGVESIGAGGRGDSEPIPLVARTSGAPESARRSLLPPEEASQLEPSASPDEASAGRPRAPGDGLADAASDSPPDSGPGWQSPDRSGEYLIPLSDEALAPPSSERVLASEELIGVLFERLHELSSVMTVGAGADYVLGTLTEHIRCDGALIHALDTQSEELVVVRAVGPNSQDVITRRTRPQGSHLEESMRHRAPLELGPNDIARSPGVWPALGVSPRYVIASPIHRHDEPFGVIELCRSAEKGPFNQAQVTALEFVCEQFADFVADRPLYLERSSPIPPPA